MNIDSMKRWQMDRLLAEARGFSLVPADVSLVKPWGGYVRFEQASLAPFLRAYWLDVDLKLPSGDSSLDPKLLLVAPKAMLSLQFHQRRAEIWRVVDGPVRIVKGKDWLSLSVKDSQRGEVIEIGVRQWHRLVGRSDWGRVAEIWSHSDVGGPSDERDILRVHDLYGRADLEADPSVPLESRDGKWESEYKRICGAAGLPVD
jgi:mannose-6-phosphate isomerase-like protein (cupin superfamily)